MKKHKKIHTDPCHQQIEKIRSSAFRRSSTPIHKYVHSLTDTEPPASEAFGSLKKCVRTYDLVY